ncbi:hypothetical protein [Chishuiella sp.]|uniref:hypothetical protein n=1 Tax=Chishuiella sp. TaxID=1969467 RepID=UPI0028AF75DE|nr:hypothetical protein [Chishuiella sp.]
MNILKIHTLLKNRKLTYKEAEQILYDFGRNERFKIFIALFDATLKNDMNIAFKVFREAYCSSDNIFKQINESELKFNLKSFLKCIKVNRINFIEEMHENEKKYYDELPNNFKIYRGISQVEFDSKDFGISWSLCEETAKNYVYFDKNEVEKGKGAIIDIVVKKEEIMTVFSVNNDIEIIYLHKISTE